MAQSYLERTLKEFKSRGFLVNKVERYNAFAGVRQDLFGVFDLLAVHPGYGLIAVQVCGADWGSHLKKMTEDRREVLILWLLSGGRVLLVGWREIKGAMTPRWKEFTARDFPELTEAVQRTLTAVPAQPFEWLK